MTALSGTRWSLVDQARGGDADAQRRFGARYQRVIVGTLRRLGVAGQEEDLAQEVFLRLFCGGVLARATPARGKFRHLLLSVTRHVAHDHFKAQARKKRGGGADVRPLGELDPPDPRAEVDSVFDRAWVVNLLQQALERLREEHPHYHQAVTLFLRQGLTQADAAAAVGRTPADVRNHVFRGRRKLMDYLREAVWDYADRADYGEELRYLTSLLSAGRAGG